MTLPVIVLASGGLDSTACIAYYLAQKRPVTALWVDYRQRAARAEEAAIGEIAAHYETPLQRVDLKGVKWPRLAGPQIEYRGRNLTLASIALNTSPPEGALIALGIHQGTPFADCDPTFIAELDELAGLLSNGLVRLDCPFQTWDKATIAEYAVSQRVPIHLTYSCERGKRPPCGECMKCQENKSLLPVLSNASSKSADVR